MKAATVFVIDDDPAVRDSLVLLLEDEVMTVAAFDSVEAFLAAFQPLPRSCAIVDVRMPRTDGLQLQEELQRRGILLPLIFLTGHGDIPQSVRAMKAGAFDFLTKPVTGSVLFDKVQAALIESESLGRQAKAIQYAKTCVAELTERERQVMLLAIDGMSNKEIARHMSISYRTVEIHKSRIFLKTGVRTLIELNAIAKTSGLRS